MRAARVEKDIKSKALSTQLQVSGADGKGRYSLSSICESRRYPHDYWTDYWPDGRVEKEHV